MHVKSFDDSFLPVAAFQTICASLRNIVHAGALTFNTHAHAHRGHTGKSVY